MAVLCCPEFLNSMGVSKMFAFSDSAVGAAMWLSSGMILMKKFVRASIFSGSVMDSYLILSKASEEFEISSRNRR